MGRKRPADDIGKIRSERGAASGDFESSPILARYAAMLDRAIELNDALAVRLDQSKGAAGADRDAGIESEATPATSLDALGRPHPARLHLFCYPYVTQNPFLDLLYADCPALGINVEALNSLDSLPGPDSVVHIHWTGRIQAGVATAAAAATRAARVLSDLRTYKAAGGRILWTIHEPLPHDCAFPEVETRFRAELADLADAVHVLHPSTIAAVSPYFAVSEAKTFVVSHPRFDGVYPNTVTRRNARARLGFDDEFVLLAFGAIRPYKHFERAIDAVAALRRVPISSHLMIAGPTYASVDNEALFARAKSDDAVTVFAHAVPDHEVQYLFNAADLVVLPYSDFLNSGVLLLAIAFDRPVLAPRNDVTEHYAAGHRVHLWDDETPFVDAAVAAARRPSPARNPGSAPVMGVNLAEALDGLGWLG